MICPTCAADVKEWGHDRHYWCPTCGTYRDEYCQGPCVPTQAKSHAALQGALKAIVNLPHIDGVGMRYTFDFNSPLGQQARAALALDAEKEYKP